MTFFTFSATNVLNTGTEVLDAMRPIAKHDSRAAAGNPAVECNG